MHNWVFFQSAKAGSIILLVLIFFAGFLVSRILYSRFFPNSLKTVKWFAGESRVDLLLDGIGDYAIFMIDPDGTIISWNKGAQRIKGYKETEILGKNIDIFYSAVDQQEGLPAKNLESALALGHYECTGWRVRKDGSRFMANVIFTPIYSKDKHLKGFAKITRDITEQKQAQDQNASLARLLEDTSDAVISIGTDYELKTWNKAAENLYGFKEEEILGRPLEEVLSIRMSEEARSALRDQLKNQGYWTGEALHVNSRNDELTILASVSQTHNENGEVNGFVMVCRDITERKRKEDHLKEANEWLEREVKENVRVVVQSEKKYKMLFESNPMPMWMMSLETFAIIDVNIAALNHYGYSRKEFMELDAKKIRPEEEEARFVNDTRQQIHAATNGGHWIHRKKGNELIHVEMSIYDFESEGKPIRLVLSNDITEQINTEEELKKSYDEIRELASHLQDIREEERAWIAREIHDELGQQLTGLKMDFSWLSKKMKNEDEFTKERIDNALVLLDNTIKSVRRIATELRPGILDDLGLVPAIEWQAEEFQKRFSIPTHFITDVKKTIFPAGISIGLFRICQESLTNIARHAYASKIEIFLNQEAENLLLRIDDNGKGFEMELPGGRKTLGLLGMKERALMMGGKFKVHSKRGEGTSVLVTIPFNIIG